MTNPLRGSPPWQTLVFVGIAVAIFYLLDVGTGGAVLADSQEWAVWRVIAGAGTTLALGLSIMGWRQLTVLQGSTEPFCRHRGRRFWYRAAAAAYVVGVVAFLATAPSTDGRRDWPAELSMTVRLGAVMLSMAVAAVPWVALVWSLHKVIRHSPVSGDDQEITTLHRRWTVLANCVYAFVALVVVAVLQVGALRLVWLAQAGLSQPQKDQFTESDVLLYGAFLAVLMAALAIPLVTSYQSRARIFVNQKYPPAAYRDEAVEAERTRLEKCLHLDISVLGNPLAAVSVLTPLITAAIAAFVPALGGG